MYKIQDIMLIMLLLSSPLFAVTKSGGINIDETWTADDTIKLIADVIIMVVIKGRGDAII